MKRCLLTSLFLFFLFCGSAFPQQGTSIRYIPGKTPVGFETEINDFLVQDSVAFPPTGACLFTGSSTIRKWVDLKNDFSGITVVRRGFGGSTIKALNYYMNDIVLPYKPSVIVVYEGDNDLSGGMTPEEFVSRCDTFIRVVHDALPETRIWFLAVKPSFARRQYLPMQDEANRQLKKLTRKRHKTGFLDIRPLMYDKQGKLRPDNFESDSLHVNRACYKAWAGYMKSRLYP